MSRRQKHRNYLNQTGIDGKQKTLHNTTTRKARQRIQVLSTCTPKQKVPMKKGDFPSMEQADFLSMLVTLARRRGIDSVSPSPCTLGSFKANF